MLTSRFARRGMVTAPNHLAAQTGASVLRDGGNAIEAAIAASAVLSVVYPHMCGLGGDAFWLIHEPGQAPMAIDASGAAGAGASIDAYRSRGLERVPLCGVDSACTVAGAVSGWQSALEISTRWGGNLPLGRLLEDAIFFARKGGPVHHAQTRALRRLLAILRQSPGFSETFLDEDGRIPKIGSLQVNTALAETLERLVSDGLDGFYRGALGQTIAADLKALGCPVTAEDMARHRPTRRRPLTLSLDGSVLHNTPPPTQGLTSMMLLGVFRRLGLQQADTADYVHGMVEATKQVYAVRDRVIADPAHMREQPSAWLAPDRISRLAAQIDMDRAAPGPALSTDGDTIWMAAADGQGRAVSYIQSIYHAFGSGVVLPNSGLLWHNRGASFSLKDEATNPLQPGRKPFHTLNPAMARLRDGRVMMYGSMGGDGQPQFQAALFSRSIFYGADIQAAVSAPRWVIGRSWDGATETVSMENRWSADVMEDLRDRGHSIVEVDAYDDLMGHAGALILHPSGMIEGAFDPRSDGSVAGF